MQIKLFDSTEQQTTNKPPIVGMQCYRQLFVLNLYAGLGGNRKHWQNVKVTAIEKDEKIANVYRRNFPEDEVIIADAHEYLQENFDKYDFIWSSPPCQSHSKMIRSGRNRKPRFADMKLYEEIIFLQTYHKGQWVVENVKPYYEPLIKPTATLGRHLFWANFDIPQFEAPTFPNMMGRQNLEAKKQMQEWLGIYYEENIYYENNHCPTQILRNCVHPDLGRHVFESCL